MLTQLAQTQRTFQSLLSLKCYDAQSKQKTTLYDTGTPTVPARKFNMQAAKPYDNLLLGGTTFKRGLAQTLPSVPEKPATRGREEQRFTAAY